MGKYNDRAGALQTMVRLSEDEKGHVYERDKIDRSVVHTREDVVLIASHMSSVNEQLSTIKWILLFVLIALIIIATEI